MNSTEPRTSNHGESTCKRYVILTSLLNPQSHIAAGLPLDQLGLAPVPG